MKNKLANLSALLLLSPMGLLAQDNKHMTLEEIIHLAANQSVEAKSTDTKILGRQLEVETAKSKQLPDAKLSGQYMAMTTPNVNLKLALGERGLCSGYCCKPIVVRTGFGEHANLYRWTY